MKNYHEDYLKLKETFLEENRKKFKAYCDANDDCRESHLERQFLNDACARMIQLREISTGGRTYQDKFKENLRDDFDNAEFKYKPEFYVDSFIKRELEKIRQKHISIYNEVDDDYRINHYCFYDFMINAPRNDVLKFLAEHNVLKDLLADPKKNLWGIIEDQQNVEYSSVIYHPVSQLVNSLKPYIQPEDIGRLTELFKKGEIEGRITIRIPKKKYFVRFFGRFQNLNLIQMSNIKIANWLTEYFDIYKENLPHPKEFNRKSEYRTLSFNINTPDPNDIKIIGIDEQKKN